MRTDSWFVPGLPKEDAFQEGMIVALRAIRAYNPEKGSLCNLIQRCLWNAHEDMLCSFRRSKDAWCSCSLGWNINEDCAVEDPGFAYFLTAAELETAPLLSTSERANVTAVCAYFTGSEVTEPRWRTLCPARQKLKLVSPPR